MKIPLCTFLLLLTGVFTPILYAKTIEKLHLVNSSYEELKSGYSCIYDEQKKMVQCTPLPNIVDKKPIAFEHVEVVDCCSNPSPPGKIIGTCTNCKYDPKAKPSKDHHEPPFFLVISKE